MGAGGGFAFDVADFAEVTKNLADRKKIIASLKKKMQKGNTKASDWTPVMAKVDHLSRIDRDIQLRYRSRIGAFRLRMAAPALGVASLDAMKKALTKIQA